jgi:ribosomal protein S18 acetylase RimI-like enzyme
MARMVGAVTVGLLADGDIVASAQCIAIDADAFPYESARFGKRSASAMVWVARLAGDRPVLPDPFGHAVERPVPDPYGATGSVVGFVAAQRRGDRFEISGIAVRRDVRRRGVGRELLRALLAAGRGRGLRLVVLHVSVMNEAAIALYEAEGFVVRRRLNDFYAAKAFGEVRDAFEMIHLLNRGP